MLPIKLQEHLNLEKVGICQSDINFHSVSMEGDRYICIQEQTNEARQLVIVDMDNKSQTILPMISAESVIMNADGSFIALKERNEGHTTHKKLQIIDFKTREKMKHFVINEDVVFWKWVSQDVIAYLTDNSLYHWSVEGDLVPVKMFDKHPKLRGNQILNYSTDLTNNWLFLIGLNCQNGKIVGTMQLHCMQLARSQMITAYSACFACFKMEGNPELTNLICFVARLEQNNKLYVLEAGQTPTGNVPFQKKSVDLNLILQPTQDDFPVAMQTSSIYDVIYIITKYGFLYLFDIETATCIFTHRINSEGTLFKTVPHKAFGGVIVINSQGKVLSVAIDENTIIEYLRNVLSNPMLAIKFAMKHNLSGADDLFLERFNHFIANGKFLDAATIAAKAPNKILRTPQTMQIFQTSSSPPGEKSPLLIYFEALLKNGKLNSFESIELCKPILAQNRTNLIEKWILEERLESSEQLGDLVKPKNTLLALSIYMRANIPNKVIQCFLENKEFHKIVLYSKKVGYNPDYLALLRTIMWSDSNQALTFAKILVNDGEIMMNIDKIVDFFLEHNHVQQCTDFLLDVLSRNKPEESLLQTRLLEINLTSAPAVADCILQRNIFSYYDRPYIAQLCEKAGLLERALEHYSDIYDIKRTLMNSSHLLHPVWLVNYFGTLSVSDTIDCLNTILSVNMRQNMQLCVQVAVRYCEQLTIDVVIDLFERHKCYEGLFNFLASIIALNTEEDVHFKYIEAACKTNQFKELERMCRESNFYNGHKVFDYLKTVKLTDHLPIIIVCDRFNFVSELVVYLYQNNLYKYIEVYVQNVNISRLPIVVGALLDAGCLEDIVKSLISTVPCLFSVDELVQQVEKRSHLKLLLPWLELQAENGSEDTCVHNSLAKIYIDINNNAERFLKENKFYDSLTIGKYCENRNPYFAFIAYKRGQCDLEIIKVCEDGALFKLEARYLIEKSDPELWATVLSRNTSSRKSLIDQVIQTTLSDVKNVDEIYITVKAFMAAGMNHELLELVERLIFDNSTFSNRNLQNLLIVTAIKTDKSRVMEYINKLDAYDPALISNTAFNHGLYEEVFSMFTKFNDNSNAIQVLINNMNDIERAYNFAERCNEPKVWSYLAEAQLKNGMVKDAINSFIKADDHSQYMNVIVQASKNLYWEELTSYLIMARKQIRSSHVDNELLYIYAITKKFTNIQEFLSESNHADLLQVGERCFDNKMFEAAKIFFKNILNFSALASTCVRLNEFEEAVNNARKANNIKTWKEICFACVVNENFHLAQICGLNVITCADELNDVMQFYRTRGLFNELLSLLESGLGLERAHMGMFTELAILYCNFDTAKLKEHLELFWSRLNIPKVSKAALDAHLWPELVFLYDKCEEYDNAISIMINHPTEAWKETYFKEIITKVTNIELYYSAIRFYLDYKPVFLNDLLLILAPRIDHSRCINFFASFGRLTFIQPYLCSIQSLNNKSINEALNNLFIEEDNYNKLKLSISLYDNFDIIALAQKLENHHLIEFRRIAAYLYRKNNRWIKSITLCKEFGLYRDAIEYASDSKSPEIVENLLIFFLEMKNVDYFVASLFHCYDLLHPDVVLELAWRYNALNAAMPYFIQVISEYIGKIDMLLGSIKRRF